MTKELEMPGDLFRENMILTSALLHTHPPVDYPRANCRRVLYHALVAANCWNEALEKHQAEVFHGIYDNFPIIADWYRTLIRLVMHMPESDRLLQGAGNFGGGDLEQAAGPSFTACWLTPVGKEHIEHFVAQHPEVRSQFTRN